jgi:hypothetical protein
LETTNEGDTSEFAPVTQHYLGVSRFPPQGNSSKASDGAPFRFVISDILMQMLLGDSRLSLNASGYVTRKSSNNFTDEESEDLFLKFIDYLDRLARQE